MKFSTILIYILSALMFATSVIYFIVAYGEYIDLLDFLEAGIDGETFEKQIEMGLFIPTGIAYLGAMLWILKKKMQSKIPYLIIIAGSVLMILIYVASRTVGVPPIGIEFYITKLDITSKILQVIIIGLSLYLLTQTEKKTIKNINK